MDNKTEDTKPELPVCQEVEQSNKIKRINGKKLRNIRKQMEFYFSDANLRKDRMLGKVVQAESKGYVDVKVFLTFNKIRMLTDRQEDVIKAVMQSNILEVNENFTKVRRKFPYIPNNEDYNEQTIYIEKLPAHADHKFIKNVFQRFGEVTYVSLPHFRNSAKHKGFAFVEFSAQESVEKACEGFKMFSDVEENDSSDNAPKKVNESKAKCLPILKSKETSVTTMRKRKRSENYEKTLEKPKVQEAEVLQGSSRKRKHEPIKDLSDAKIPKREESDDVNVDDKSLERKLDSDTLPSNSAEIEKNPISEEESTVIEQSISDIDNAINQDAKTVCDAKSTKRKRKKTSDAEKLKLRVMSMAEWRMYRNRYLTMQRKAMSAVKKMLLIDSQQRSTCESMLHHSTVHGEASDKNNEHNNAVKKLCVEFKEGVIVKVTLTADNLPAADELVKKVKGSVENIAYADTSRIGESEMFLRFTSPESALSSLDSETLKELGAAEVLSGENESNYWKKLEQDRMEQRNRPRRKQRGRDKVLIKANKLMEKKNSHIIFEN